MKKIVLAGSLCIACFVCSVYARDIQDVLQGQVPSLIVNNFQQSFPGARDVEWELFGKGYKVSFETGIDTDHDVWYDRYGKQVQHKEELSERELPGKLQEVLKHQFAGYRIKDVKRHTAAGKVTYTLELKGMHEEWDAAFDGEGNLLSKVAD